MVALSELFNLSPEALAMRRRDALANMPPTEFINPPVDLFQLAAFKPPGRPRPGDIRGGQQRFIQDSGGGGGIGAPRTSPVPQVGKRRVVDMEVPSSELSPFKGRTEIVVNPSRRDITRMIKRSEGSGSPFEDGQLRYTINPDTRELYVWEAFKATHGQIGDPLGLPALGPDTGFISDERGKLIADSAFSTGKVDVDELLKGGRTTGETFDLSPVRIIENNLTFGPVKVRDVGNIKDIDDSFAPLISDLNESGLKTSFSHSALTADHPGEVAQGILSIPHIGFELTSLTDQQRTAIEKVAKDYDLEVRETDSVPPSLFVEGRPDDLLGGKDPDGKILDAFEGFTSDLIRKLGL